MTLTRRSVVASATAAGVCGCGGAAFAQWPGTRTAPRQTPVAFGGCGLNHEQAISFVRDIRFTDYLDDDGPIDRFFEDSVAAVGVAFDVDPAFAFFDDRAAPNAYATPFAVLGGDQPDGAVLFGETLLRTEMRNRGATAGSSLFVIVAHEFAHILQFRKQRGGRLPDTELEADFLAGWMLGGESVRQRNRVLDVQLRTAAETMFRLGGYDFNHPDFHGTPEQRMTAVLRGFELGRQRFTVEDAYRAALRGG